MSIFSLSIPVHVHIHMYFLFCNKSNMTRTKNGIRRRPANPAAKTPCAMPRKQDAPAMPQPDRFRLSTRGLWKSGSGVSASWNAFSSVICRLATCFGEIAQDYMAAPRFQAKVIEALHSMAESHLVKLFEDTNLLAHHPKRVTTYRSDLRLVCRIRGERE